MNTTSATMTVTLAVTGASGIPYALRLLECLIKAKKHVYFLLSPAAHSVAALEMDGKLPTQTDALEQFLRERYGASKNQIRVFAHQEWTAPIASGSGVADAMIICPCSMGCLSAIAVGASNNLIERAADVALKEGRRLILVPRETPLSAVHLENMLKLARLGVTILPANPGFYHKPTTLEELVDFLVARILDQLSIKQSLIAHWGFQQA